MTDVAPFEAALHDEGIDYHTTGGSAFYAQQEVTDLVNVLSVVEDPLDPVAFAGVLRSPFFGLSDDGLYWLATGRRDLHEGLRLAGSIVELSDEDRRRAVRARDLLDRWRGVKDREPIAALVDRILGESGYEAALLGEFLGARKRANARKLVRMARAFDRQGGFTLADFVARLRADLRNPPREEQAATTDEEGTSVRLMSIHQAKGLEFPIVVIPDLNRESRGFPRMVAFDPELGPLVRVSGDGDDTEEGSGESLGWRVHEAREKREDEQEALRLFYVAATRARDALILSAGAGPADKPKAPAMRLLDARFDRGSGACLAPLPDGWAAPRTRVILDAPPQQSTRTRPSVWRPDLREVARTIAEAVPREVAPQPAPARRARLVDLDPALTLPPGRARVDRLVRAILADPRALDARELPDVARRAALRVTPAAHPGLVADAVERLLPWLDGPLVRQLRDASEVERAIDWTIAWPPDQRDATVFQGRLDLLYQNREGEWGVIQFSDALVPEPWERLRLRLSAHAATVRGLGPIRQGWRIRLGPGGRASRDDRFDAAAISEAASAYWG
jgi:ATP-dependent helicase/nuclease subunit A